MLNSKSRASALPRGADHTDAPYSSPSPMCTERLSICFFMPPERFTDA